MRLENSSKATILKYLKENITSSIIDDFVVFSVGDWNKRRDHLLQQIGEYIDHDLVAVRSSANDEKGFITRAGYYTSKLHVEMDKEALIDAITSVVASYKKNNRKVNQSDEIIVQSYVSNALLSGVVFSYDTYDKPYYTINYDDRSRNTNSVTLGRINNILRIARWADLPDDNLWKGIVDAVQEIEQHFPDVVINTEFAIDENRAVHIFQARAIRILGSATSSLAQTKKLVTQLQTNLTKFQDVTVLSDMCDWNPAEILGPRPNSLDVSLYRYLVTRETWGKARTSLGYTDVRPNELMLLIGDKPYIDAKISFQSLIPENIDQELKGKLLRACLTHLANNPELHDKVEFDVLFSCFDFTFDVRKTLLTENGFTLSETDILRTDLLEFTRKILREAPQWFERVKKRIAVLPPITNSNSLDKPDYIQQVESLLIQCRDYGVEPFSLVARLAFVGMVIFRSLLQVGIITKKEFSEFLGSITTISSDVVRDSNQLMSGEISMDQFMEMYGHLRPSTYDIQSRRFDQMTGMFVDLPQRIGVDRPHYSIEQENSIANTIDKVCQEYFQISGQEMLVFVRKGIQLRELAKFEFSKSLSGVLEIIANIGNGFGLDRETISHITIDDLLQIMMNRENHTSVSDTVTRICKKNRYKKKILSDIELPPVITRSADLEFVKYPHSAPNFVTEKKTVGNVSILGTTFSERENVTHIQGKIVLLENADPGFDWIFGLKPLGLVTKYGGVGSHMAIRCTEFGLPAAIGCGEQIWESIAVSSRISIDCLRKEIKIMD